MSCGLCTSRSPNRDGRAGAGCVDRRMRAPCARGRAMTAARSMRRRSSVAMSCTWWRGSSSSQGAAEIGVDAQLAIARVAARLNERRYRWRAVLVEGHSDASGSGARNEQLSVGARRGDRRAAGAAWCRRRACSRPWFRRDASPGGGTASRRASTASKRAHAIAASTSCSAIRRTLNPPSASS